MSEATAPDFESLLRRALAPVEPPEDLSARLESTLTSLTEAAQDELDAWEMSSMRDPRNWVRPAAAAVVGTGAGTALVVLRTRQRSKRRRAQASDPIDLVERTVRDLVAEARRVLR